MGEKNASDGEASTIEMCMSDWSAYVHMSRFSSTDESLSVRIQRSIPKSGRSHCTAFRKFKSISAEKTDWNCPSAGIRDG
jgi:hypothetical protein